jgi:phospholipid transport system substrate-binding protein
MNLAKIARFGGLALLLAAPVTVQAQAADPATRIATYNAAVVAIMKAGLAPPARTERFETLVAQHYDMAGIAALVVGPAWAAAPAADKASAVKALTRHSAVQLARNFDAFDGERFVTDPKVQTRGTSSIVKVTISTKDGSDVLQYRLRQSGGEWRIIDVVAQGISQTTLQRADFAATIAKDGVAGMARALAARDRL